MTNTFFPALQTQYNLDFSSASCSETLGYAPNTENFQSKDVVLQDAILKIFWQCEHSYSKDEV
jgi:hypothetical protein